MTRSIISEKNGSYKEPFFSFSIGWVLGLGDLSSFQAAGANARLANMAALIADGDLLNIGTKSPVAHPMGVTDAATSNRVLSAYFANL